MVKITDLRCIHRHSITEHQSCFAKGLVKWPDATAFEKLSGKPWYQFPGYKIGYLDIECDNLSPDWGNILTWCIKDKDGDVSYDVITKEDLYNEVYDRRVVQSLVDKMREYSILVGYYSTKMDMPYIRAKAMHYNIDFPNYGEIYHFDLYYVVRDKLHLSRNSLDNVCDWLGIKGKTQIDKDAWRRGKYGDKESLEKILEHNVGDVVITEQLHDRLDFCRKWIKRSI